MQRSYIADLERGYRNPSVRTLVKIANALGVAPMTLLEDEARAKKGPSQ
jgi:transcriptional regulator with XRE-family HTH domain